MHRLIPAAFALILVCVAPIRAEDSRVAFLALIDRPKVTLQPQHGSPTEKGALTELAFSFATEMGQRVPGILVKATATTGRRPVVVALHGTGGNKETQRALLEDLAREGFVGVAIDGRYHGERAKGGKAVKSAEYIDAALRAFRTGKEHPFFFDTAWDVM